MLKKLWEWIKHPHGWALIPFYIFTAISIAGAIAFTVIGRGTDYGFVAYIFYALAAITFVYTVYSIIELVPKLKSKLTDKLKTNKFTANVIENYDFKTKVFALISFIITVVFAIMNFVSAMRYRLIWYGAIAAYYFVLVLFRGSILLANQKCAKKFVNDINKYEKCKLQIYLASGAFLILLEFAMIAAITQMMLSERHTQSGEIMAISTAAYTFYKTIMAIINLVKARKSKEPITQSLRNLNFADACMSVVSLTVLMISTFDKQDSSATMLYVKSIVGLTACVGIIVMAFYMIVKATKELKSLKINGDTTDE